MTSCHRALRPVGPPWRWAALAVASLTAASKRGRRAAGSSAPSDWLSSAAWRSAMTFKVEVISTWVV